MGLGSWIGRLLTPARRLEGVESSAAGAPSDQMQAGIARLNAGDLPSAARHFRAAVQQAPGSAAPRINLAYVQLELGQFTEALSHLQEAARIDDASFDAHYMLAGVLERSSELNAAASHLLRAIELRPDFDAARTDLCRVLAADGRQADAQAAILAAIEINPRNADFHHYLGNLLLSKDPESAVASYARALELVPDYAQVHANLGLAYQALERFDLAVESFERALSIDPSLVDVQVKRGLALKSQGRFAEAEAALARALEARPDDAETWNRLGTLRHDQGRLADAIECYERAIKIAPDQPGAYGNLGLALFDSDRVGEAIEVYRRGIAVRPLATTHDNLAIALQRVGAIDEAIEHYQRALAIDPDNLNTRCNLGAALADGRGPGPAIAAYREILKVKPDHLVAHSNLLFNMAYDGVSTPQDYLAEARALDNKLKRGLLAPIAAQAGKRPLRVGFVSGDLRSHPVGFFLEGIVDAIDPERFELCAYSTSPTEDELTQRLKRRLAPWRLIKPMSDEAASQAIRDDGVDILIDLAGHTGLNRLAVFAMRPAPVQVSWLGYFASTGLTCIDYVLADPHCVRAGDEEQFSETVWRLPDTRLCYTPPSDQSVPAVAELPALKRGHVTFGCFQRMPKLNDEVLRLWGRVFASIPTAKLWLQSPQMARPAMVEEALRRLEACGIARERVIVRPPTRREDYLAAYGEVDIVLDTFPYTGGTTTCEALWMGVPTLTLAGDTMLSRQGVAMMTCAGLPEWVADSWDEFVAKAVDFAADSAHLASVRQGMRERVRSSPLFDSRRFAVELQDALERMWAAKATG